MTARRPATHYIHMTWRDTNIVALASKLQGAGLYHVLEVLGAELQLEGDGPDVVATFLGTSGGLEIVAETLLAQGVRVQVVAGKPSGIRE